MSTLCTLHNTTCRTLCTYARVCVVHFVLRAVTGEGEGRLDPNGRDAEKPALARSTLSTPEILAIAHDEQRCAL